MYVIPIVILRIHKMQITLKAKKEYNQILELIYDNPLNAHEIAEYLKMNGRQAARFKLAWLLKNNYIVQIDTGAGCRSKVKWLYKSLRKSLPHGNEGTIRPLENSNARIFNPFRTEIINLTGIKETFTIEKLKKNTAKGILNRSSAFIGNSLETMSF